MVLTRNFKSTILERAKHDAKFRRALFENAINEFLTGDLEVAKSILITDDFWVLKALVIARSEATKQSRNAVKKPGLLRRFAPRNDEVAIKAPKNDS